MDGVELKRVFDVSAVLPTLIIMVDGCLVGALSVCAVGPDMDTQGMELGATGCWN